MALGCVLLMGLSWIGLRSRIIPDEGVYAIAIILGSSLLPLLVAMGVIGTDRAENSLEYLLSLPVSASRILSAKLLVATAAILAPLLGSLLVCLLLSAGREMSVCNLFGAYSVGAWCAIHLLIWTVAFGVRAESESTVALWGFLVVVVWIAYGLFVAWVDYMLLWDTEIGGKLKGYACPAVPFGLATLFGGPRGSWPTRFQLLALITSINIHIVTSAALLWWSVRRLAPVGRKNS